MLKDRLEIQDFTVSSQNISMTGQGNKKDNSYKILQITINGKNLFDQKSKLDKS